MLKKSYYIIKEVDSGKNHMLKKIFKRLNKTYRNYNNKEINIEELKELQKEGAIVIDVRSRQEYDEGHLERSILLTDYDINNKTISKITYDKERIIIVYCSTGHRSRRVQKKLNKMGYKNVYNLYGGLEEY